eukprot:CAMPEP_0117651768 /NCGR_PEP_ID=MMETSP0804-20121206/2269_1 /TAXON_ID=1074897 /ORGANISM="Tetraselmis astigmatica, Strain CCMP880" /LENGTH=618 /DNA_ID=CAMNT_0005457769 /DNA_START=360 /DNA_END=2216 /DNA_ORIENTATION=+
MMADVSVVDERNLCQRLCGRETWSYWTFGKGDVGGFFQLFFDNVATTLTLTFLVSMAGLGLLQDKEIYQGFLPGLGLTMLFGNLYYSWMSVRLDAHNKTFKATANPYGINTPGAFAFMFGVMLPVAYNTVCPDGVEGSECDNYKSEETLRIAVSANFLQGIFAVLLGLVGPYIYKVCPTASLVAALGGIGIGVLGVGQIVYGYEYPLAGMVPVFLMLMLYFSGINTGWVPEACVIAGVGTILAWADGLTDGQAVSDSFDTVGWKSPSFLLVDIFKGFGSLGPYLGTVIPVAVTAAANTLMCWRSAVKNGDDYDLRETMVADGIGSCVGAIFGCPFGTSVYIGHSAYKKIGARSGYSVLNACAFLILTFFGLFNTLGAIVPITAVAPMNLFVGIMICADAFESVPFRHIPAVVLGLMPSIADWAKNACSPTPTSEGNYQCINTAPQNAGLVAFSSGPLLVSMVLSAIFASLCDRKFLTAVVWCAVAGFLSLFGVIHAPSAGADFDNGTPQSQWKYCVGYLTVGGIFFITWLFQKFTTLVPKGITEPMESLSVYQLVHIAYNAESNVEELMGGHREVSAADMAEIRAHSLAMLSHSAGGDDGAVETSSVSKSKQSLTKVL